MWTRRAAALLIGLGAIVLLASGCDGPTAPPQDGSGEQLPGGDDEGDSDDGDDGAGEEGGGDGTEDPVPPVIEIVADSDLIYEHGEPVELLIERDAVGDLLEIAIAFDGTATAGTDYLAAGVGEGLVKINADEMSASITITPIDDEECESSEELVVSLGAGEGYELGDWSASTLTIKDNDAPLHDPVSLSLGFDTTVIGYSSGAFAGAGFANEPADGQLDADGWQVSGVSDGEKPVGAQALSGDFARGTSAGGESTGGIYAFEVAPADWALGAQPTSSDFSPGVIAAVLTNTTGGPVDTVCAQYQLWWFNDAGRSSSVELVLSTDGEEWFTVESTQTTTPEAADPEPYWQSAEVGAEVRLTVLFESGLLADGRSILIGIRVDDVAGSGGRDEIAINDLSVTI